MANPKIRVQLAPSFRASVKLGRCKPCCPTTGAPTTPTNPTNPGGTVEDETPYAMTDENGAEWVDETGAVMTYTA